MVKVVRKLLELGVIRGHNFSIDTETIFKDSPGFEYAKKSLATRENTRIVEVIRYLLFNI